MAKQNELIITTIIPAKGLRFFNNFSSVSSIRERACKVDKNKISAFLVDNLIFWDSDEEFLVLNSHLQLIVVHDNKLLCPLEFFAD